MKIIDRKYTTNNGKKELQELVDSLSESMQADIENIDSELFNCAITLNNDYQDSDIHFQEWTNHFAKWVVRDGVLKLFSKSNFQYADYDFEAIRIDCVHKINFNEAIAQLEKLIKKYNEASMKKEKEIESFLAFCEKYKLEDK